MNPRSVAVRCFLIFLSPACFSKYISIFPFHHVHFFRFLPISKRSLQKYSYQKIIEKYSSILVKLTRNVPYIFTFLQNYVEVQNFSVECKSCFVLRLFKNAPLTSINSQGNSFEILRTDFYSKTEQNEREIDESIFEIRRKETFIRNEVFDLLVFFCQKALAA